MKAQPHQKSIGFLRTGWNAWQVGVFLLLLAANILINHFVAAVEVLPIWLDSLCGFLGVCVGGPVYGSFIILLSAVINVTVLGASTMRYVLAIISIGLTVFFSLYVHLGFFGKKRGILIGIVLISFFNTCMLTPINLAIYGGVNPSNSLLVGIYNLLQDGMGMYLPAAAAISYFVANLIDKALVMFAVYGIVTHLPDKVAKNLRMQKNFPTMTIVPDDYEEPEEKSETAKGAAK